jgi:gas vesicle protein
MLLAPRSGSELRHGLAQSASDLQRAASESLNQATKKVRETAERGREAYTRVKENLTEVRREGGSGTAPEPSGYPSSTPGGYVS